MATRLSGTVTKALEILEKFIDAQSDLTVSQLSSSTGINKSTVVRLCATLESQEYLQRRNGSGYSIGPKVEKLSKAYRAQFDLEDLIRPILQTLRDETEESTSFFIIDGVSRICLYRENSHHLMRHVIEEGTRFPLANGIAGSVIRAYSGDSSADSKQIRKDGYLTGYSEDAFTVSISVPVITKEGGLIGALAISGLSSRFKEKNRKYAIALLKDSQDQLTAILPTGATLPRTKVES
jgi:DNA-binding IclR family transcriptional regulator